MPICLGRKLRALRSATAAGHARSLAAAFALIASLVHPADASAVTPGYVEIVYDVAMGPFYFEGMNPLYGNSAEGPFHGSFTIRWELDQHGAIRDGGTVEVVALDLNLDLLQTVFVPGPDWVEFPWFLTYRAPDTRWDGVPGSALTPGSWRGVLDVPIDNGYVKAFPTGRDDGFEEQGGCTPGSEFWPGEPSCTNPVSPIVFPVPNELGVYDPLLPQPVLPPSFDHVFFFMRSLTGHPYFDALGGPPYYGALPVVGSESPAARTLVQVDSGWNPPPSVPSMGLAGSLVLASATACLGWCRLRATNR